VTVTFESDWKKAKEILGRIAQNHSVVKSEQAAAEVRRAAKKFLIHFEHLTPIVWPDVQASGIQLTIRCLCEPRNRRSSANAIWEEVLQAFGEEPKIDFAYPTQRFYAHATEGKPELRPGVTD